MKVNRLRKFLPNTRNKILAVVIAGVLLVCDYFISNLSFPVFDSSDSLGLVAYLKSDSEWGYDQLLAADVSLDKEFATVYDEYGDSAGRTAITDRKILAAFLDSIKGSYYKYIFIDIRFEDNLVTEADSALFAIMGSMPRLVFSTHRGMEQTLHPLAPAEKAAYSDYRHLRTDGFSRYEFLQSGHESVALRLYRDLDGGDVRSLAGILYADGVSPCYNTQFLDIPRAVLDEFTPDGEIRYPHLGTQLLAKYTADELRQLVTGRIVVIGDYANDLHQSFIGSVPGPLLSYYGYLTLHEGRHKVNIIVIIILAIAYSLIAYLLLTGHEWPRFRHPALSFAVSLLSWGIVLNAVKIAIYLCFAVSISISLPTLVFSIIPLEKRFKKIKENQQSA